MKKGIMLISILVVILENSRGNSVTELLFNEGNKYYADANYEMAIHEYDSILAVGFESAGLYLNIGNAYYKLRNYPKAILYYEKALLIEPGNEKVKHNLAKAQIYTVDKINEIPEFLITGWMNQLIVVFRSNTWAVISAVSFILALALFLTFFLSMKLSLKRGGFYSGIIFLLISVTTFYLSYKSKSLLIHGNGAIVITPTVTIKGSPSDSGTDLFIIHEGIKVYIMDEIDSWCEIKIADGKTGWLPKNDIALI
jgi:hypothetical protein